MKYWWHVNNYKMATVRNFDVLSGKFNVFWICTSGNYAQNGSLNIHLLFLIPALCRLKHMKEGGCRKFLPERLVHLKIWLTELDFRGSRVRFPAEAVKFSLHHRVQTGSGAYPKKGLSLGVKRPEPEVEQSPPTSAGVKDAWSCTPTTPIRLHGVVLS